MADYRDLVVPLPVAADVAHELMAENKALRARCERLRKIAVYTKGSLYGPFRNLSASRLKEHLAAAEKHGDLDPLDGE